MNMIYSPCGRWVIGGIDGFGVRMLIDPIPVWGAK